MRPYRAHCLVVPFPVQGHINPMLQFSKRLQHEGIRITFAPTLFIFNSIMHGVSNSIAVEPISDGYDDGGFAQADNKEDYLASYQQVGSQTLADLIEKLQGLDCPVDCIVYDSFLPWVLDVAKKFGLLGAVFITQSCGVCNIFHHVYQGSLKLPVAEPKIMLPGLPPLEPQDMPSFIYVWGSYPPFLKMLVNQFSNIDKTDWVLCNNIYDLEKEEVDWMAKQCPFRTIGPTIPSMYLDKRLEDDKEYGLSIYDPKTDDCLKWLNDRSDGSIVYVSFGSMVELEAEQMEEVAWGLKESSCYFLWVVRASEEAKLPQNFVEENSEKGLVVTWCPQLDVLSHKAIGCFVTHCGWNSTLEALSLGVAMVGIPQWADQSTNAKYVMDVWRIGLKAKPDEKGIVRKQVLGHCIKEIMEGGRGEEIRRNAMKWRELAKNAVDEGGSSDRNIDEFVAKLAQS